jgi:hypothetical protein
VLRILFIFSLTMAAIPPPAVADPHANASLDDAYQGGHVNAETRAARASKRRKTAETLHNNNSMTEQELGQQEVFHQQQVTSALPAGAAIPGAPAWFGPAMAAAMAAALAPINARLDNVVAGQENIIARQENIIARQENATVFHETDALQPIRDAAGNIAPNFPATYGALYALTPAERSQLLVFYGRPANPVSSREPRLKQLLGIRP